MGVFDAIAQFIQWLQALLDKPQKVEPPPIFSKETTISQWQLGRFHCIGVLPNDVRPNHLYTLSCEQVQVYRNKTPAEVRYINENAPSLVPTHRFTLTYCPPAIRDGKAVLGRRVTVFRVERNCNIKGRPGTSADWIACGEIAPKLRDRIIEICNSPATETRYQLKGKILKEGQTAPKREPSRMQAFEIPNPNRLELIPTSDTNRKWEAFIDNLLTNCDGKNRNNRG